MYLKPRCFRKTVDSTNTAERLTDSNVKAVWVRIQPEDDNATPMYIGDSQVSTSNGLELIIDLLAATDMQGAKYLELGSTMDGAIPISLKDIWVLCGTNGDGVNCMYLERVE